jgi:hypothetical protein
MGDNEREKIRNNCYNSSVKINYDFIKMRPTNTKFVCRFLDKAAEDKKP